MSGEPFHNFEYDVEQVQKSFHAYYTTKSVDGGVKHAAKMAIDRARRAGYNPREGHVMIYFDDFGVGAKWVPIPKEPKL